MKHETMEYDVLIVGAGPAGLAAAIKLKQLANAANQTLTVCILEKGAQVGAHILSGAVLEPRSLQELLPDTWKNAPLDTPATEDFFYYLTAQKSYRLPTPKPMKNDGNFIISLSNLCQFLAKEAEALGCEIYPGFAGSEVLYSADGAVIGVATGDLGIDKAGEKTPHYQPGMHLFAQQTLFAEGCRGQLSEQLIQRFELRKGRQAQTYALGVKELWQVKPENHHLGRVIHTVGWPLNHATYGGSFIYHLSQNRVAIGFVVGLDYQNPYLSPFNELQQFKTHPLIRQIFEGGERLCYGARALNEGGWQSIPKLSFPGGALIGDAAGFLNVPKIKGIHTSMQSGMLAAAACLETLASKPSKPVAMQNYQNKIDASWVSKELYAVRNIRPGFHRGLTYGLLNAAFETYLTRGKSPWTLGYQEDYSKLLPAKQCTPITYPKPDGVLTFDRLSSVYLSNTFHEENQVAHLKLNVPNLAITVNYQEYASPEIYYCPAAVYEIVNAPEKPRLQINAQNCIHCKTCDIKDPRQNIQWTAPTGGGGPNYQDM